MALVIIVFRGNLFPGTTNLVFSLRATYNIPSSHRGFTLKGFGLLITLPFQYLPAVSSRPLVFISHMRSGARSIPVLGGLMSTWDDF